MAAQPELFDENQIKVRVRKEGRSMLWSSGRRCQVVNGSVVIAHGCLTLALYASQPYPSVRVLAGADV